MAKSRPAVQVGSGEAGIERCASPKLAPSLVVFEPDLYAGTPPAEPMDATHACGTLARAVALVCRQGTLTAAIGLDAIPVGVDHEGCVVVRAIVRAQARRAIVGPSSAEGSDMERIDGLTCGRGKAEVEV